MKRKRILMFMVALTMGMIGCTSKPKEGEISVESDSPQEMDSEEAAYAKRQNQKRKLQNCQSQRSQKMLKKLL